MKSLITSIAILGLISLTIGVAGNAADTANVSATVTAELITISVADGVVDYGILPVSASASTLAGDLDDLQTVTNNSNVPADLEIKSSDAVGGTDWNLAAAAGADAFTHEFSTNSGTSWTSFNVDNTTYSALATSVAASGGTQTFDLQIGTPSSVTDNVQKTITVTVLATAS